MPDVRRARHVIPALFALMGVLTGLQLAFAYVYGGVVMWASACSSLVIIGSGIAVQVLMQRFER